MVMGGSTGSKVINDIVRGMLPTLLRDFQVIHLCGKGNLDSKLANLEGYAQFDYIKKELSDLLAASNLIISRAGANAICEILALRIPNILIPLSQKASRGDQILNAESFENLGYSYVLKEEDLSVSVLLEAIETVIANKTKYIEAMNKSELNKSIDTIMDLIKQTSL
jgi:UDP-N-acetylglucosamine--N-acetylmuramyl-(pentapeptide) pyrophosphoryl-undecaprenol N-acetylglucosamine transferase